MAALAGFLTSREAARAMIERGRGTILFTGATASVRGGAGFSAFAGAKHALRALAQSLARELGPKGIHVAHVVIDGAIDGAFIRGLMPDAAEKLDAGGNSRSRRDRQELCLALSPEAQRLDVRDGPAAVVGDVVMSATIEFIFDFGSPNAYLAYRALPPILERTGARLVINPCLLGGIFKATGNQAPAVAFAAVKGKLDYEMLEIRRFIARHGIDKFRLNPHFPVNTLMLMRGLVAAREAGDEAAYLEMGLQGLWEEGLKLDDPGGSGAPDRRRGPQFGEPACGGPDRSRQAEARRQHRRRGRARRVRDSDLFRRRRRCSSARSGWGRSKRRSRRAASTGVITAPETRPEMLRRAGVDRPAECSR